MSDTVLYKDNELTRKLGFEQQDTIAFWSSLLGSSSSSVTLENLYLSFLLKFEHSFIIQNQEASGFTMGKTVNLILQEMVSNSILQKYKRETNLMLYRYLAYFDELVHNIYNMIESQE